MQWLLVTFQQKTKYSEPMGKTAKKYFNIYRYHSSRSRIFALKMMLNTFKEIDLFDLVRRVDTRSIRKEKLGSVDYMWYSPVYTGVAKEMISIAYDFYNSAIKYSEFNQKTVFLDLGGGSGKPSLLACEHGSFSRVISVDVDPFLVNRAKKNFKGKGKSGVVESFLGNVEDEKHMQSLFMNISSELVNNYVLFVFNKNSYGQKVLEASLRLIDQYGPKHVIYLYQNPIHKNSFKSYDYKEFQRDAEPNNAHKNFKYILFWK